MNLPAQFVIIYNVPSQNAREKVHWAARGKQRKLLTELVYYSSHQLPRATGKRWVTITSYRKQRIKDDANLRGGAKGLLDAMVHARLLVDDSDKLVHVTYRQGTLAQIPAALVAQWKRRPLTVIEITDQAPELQDMTPRIVIDEQEAKALGVVP